MRLTEILAKKRDDALAEAAKYADLIEIASAVEGHRRPVVRTVRTVRTNGTPTPHATKHSTDAFRRAASRRMKLLWKRKRALMLKGVRKGARNAAKAKAAAVTT